ncbi:MAG: class III poly(R)-hydroxyalkanoic acid synthase subunit PhaC [Thaumarchaeota archaeon]|nr:class III poly(R)-hydroxyalkanoic acid synthase subunit PhaC [Nitrososphaerota archaeon]
MDSEWLKSIERTLTEWNKRTLEGMLSFGGSPSVANLDVKIESAPSETVWKDGRVKLLHYKPLKKKTLRVPLLVVYALINRYYILDLQPDRSVIRRYLERGIDVYVIDWGDPAPSDRYESIGDQLEYIDSAIDFVRDGTSVEKVNLQGYCMGGTFSVIYSALWPRKVKSLIAQAAPVDFSTDSGILNVWSRHIDADKIVETFGNVPASFMNIGFLLINPIRLMFDKYVTFYGNIGDREFVENFLRMEKWIFDSPDVPGEAYRQFLKDLYQKNLLAKNELIVDGKKVSLKSINMPLLNLVAEQDNLVPPDSSKPLNRLVSSRDKKLLTFPGGHIGLSVSARAHKEFWPQVADWIAEKSVK